MTDPLPADVRELLELLAQGGAAPAWAWSYAVKDVLAKYPAPQPAHGWQPGDVVTHDAQTWLRQPNGNWVPSSGFASSTRRDSQMVGAALLVRGGRRVRPERFKDHAKHLHDLAGVVPLRFAPALRRIADDLDGGTP